VTMVTFLFYL